MRQGADDRLSARTEIISLLRKTGPMSQAELARASGLSPSTVSPIFAILRREGIITEAPGRHEVTIGPKGGRPGIIWTLRSSIGVVIGIDFGKKHVRIAIADLAHNILSEKMSRIQADSLASAHIVEAVALIDSALTYLGLDRSHVMTVGAGIAGPVRRENGQLGDSTILPGWIGVNAAEALADVLDLPIEVANDANLGALSEWMWGAARGCQDAIYVKASTGIGGGLILNGAPYSGSGGTAGELGHVVIDLAGPLCRCGNSGCLEAVAGSSALLASLTGPRAPTSISELIALARTGDQPALQALEHAGRSIGTALATVSNLINPSRIVIGGELARAEELVIEPLRAALYTAALASAGQDVEVVLGELGSRAEVLGAVALALRGRDDFESAKAIETSRTQFSALNVPAESTALETQQVSR